MRAGLQSWLPDGQDVRDGAPLGVLLYAIAYVLGGIDHWVTSLVILVILDLVTGVGAAFIRKDLASADLARGMVKKSLYFAAVALAALVEREATAFGIGEIPLREMLVGCLFAAEGLSIIENLHKAGVPIPGWLITRLRVSGATARGESAAP